MRVRVELAWDPDVEGSSGYRATIDEVDGEPAIDLELDNDGGFLHCRTLVIREPHDLASRDVRIPIDRYMGLVADHPALRGGHATKLTPPKRRALTDEFLEAVAAAYVAGGNSIAGITGEVDPRFANAGESTKYRWVKAARDRGLFAPRSDRGR